MARKALGRGLEALIPSGVDIEVPIIPRRAPTSAPAGIPATEARDPGDIQHVALAKIIRNRPSREPSSDPSTIERTGRLHSESAASCSRCSFVPPPTAIKSWRRTALHRDAEASARHRIPAIVRPLTDREALLIALIENIQARESQPD